MKKPLLLIAVAFGAISANAQQDVYDAVTFDATDNTVTMADDFTNATIADGSSVVEVTVGKVTMKAVGGTTPADNSLTVGPVVNEDLHYYEVVSVSEWNEVKWGTASQGDIEFAYLTGTGNPYVKLYAEEIYTDDAPTGTYRAAYDYYEPDGSVGLPVQGLYYEFTTAVGGTLRIGVWINKGNRKLFVVDKETGVALTPVKDYTLDGYENGVSNEDGSKAYTESIPTKGTEGEDLYIWGQKSGGQAIWGWLNIPTTANKTYMVFLHSAQIGFKGFEFTYNGDDTGISDVTLNTEDAVVPVCNLAGQRVGKDAKGFLIQNGKKFIRK